MKKKVSQSKATVVRQDKGLAKSKRQAPMKSTFVIGRLKGKIRVTGDIVSPAVPLEYWEYD